MPRFSLRALMTFVLIFAVVFAGGLAAFKNPSDSFVQVLLFAPIFALSAIVLGVTFLRGRRRAQCIGFAFFGIVYVALSADYRLGETIRPHLATTHLLKYVHDELVSSPLVLRWFQAVVADGSIQSSQVPASRKRGARRINYRFILTSPAYNDHFQRAGHRLFALLFGLVGGATASSLYSRRERTRESGSA
jgi:hypothetical protein